MNDKERKIDIQKKRSAVDYASLMSATLKSATLKSAILKSATLKSATHVSAIKVATETEEWNRLIGCLASYLYCWQVR